MSNMEASIKTYNKMTVSLNKVNTTLMMTSVASEYAESAYKRIADACSQLNNKIKEVIYNTYRAHKANSHLVNIFDSVKNKIEEISGNTNKACNSYKNLSDTFDNLNSKVEEYKEKTSDLNEKVSITQDVEECEGESQSESEPEEIVLSEKILGIGSKIAGGFKTAFDMAAKGFGMFKNALNTIAPERMEKLSGMWNDAFSNMMSNVAAKLGPAFDKLEELMVSPAFQTLMGNIETAISCLVPVFAYIMGFAEPLLNIINQIFSFIIENSGTLVAVLLGIASAFGLITLATIIYNGVLQIQAAIANIAKIANGQLNMVISANPVMWIVKAIIVLIMILITLIATVEPVREAFAKLAVGFIGFIENGINLFLEALAGLAEGILNFAGGAINTFLDIFVNPFIDGINMIIGACNKVFGTDFKQLDHMSVDFSEKAESVSEAILSKKVDASGLKEAVGEGINNFDASKITDMLNPPVTDSFESGAELAGEKLGENPYPTPPMAAGGGGPQASNDMPMEEQDMQLLREVAERESLNSYTTMTPSVKIDVGNIHENADAEKIIQEIVERIIQEMEATAKGVVAV